LNRAPYPTVRSRVQHVAMPCCGLERAEGRLVGIDVVGLVSGCVVVFTISRCKTELLDSDTDGAEVWSGSRILRPAWFHYRVKPACTATNSE